MKKPDLTVLVLGVGGNVSQGILKALAVSDLQCRVIGACVSPLSAGLYTVDRAYISPLASAPEFVDWVIDLCRKEGIDAILSGVEPVLAALAPHAAVIREQTGAVCIVSAPEQIAIAQDKLLTCEWLKAHNLNYPAYAATGDRQAVAHLLAHATYPLVAKPRHGKGGQGIFEIADAAQLEHIMQAYPDYVIQQYLGDSDSEYTVGCFCDQTGAVRGSIAMRRELLHGTTYRAIIGAYDAVQDEAQRIASALKPVGPCNIQLRMDGERPVCFEINLRFSGTTPVRARLGFNDVAATLRHYVLGEPAPQLPRITAGIMLRYWNEFYVDPAAYAELVRDGRLDDPGQYPLTVEDYGGRS